MNNIVFQLNGTSYDLSKKNVMSCSFLHPVNKHYLQHGIKNIGLDFLTIGEIVSFCDRQVPRDKSDDAWSRRITIVIPVLEIEKWEMVKKDLIDCLSFLSGDYWDISFIKREKTDTEKKFNIFNKNHRKTAPTKCEHRKICMLSGGLDSFIGAIDLLNATQNVVFVNIHGRGNGFKSDFITVRDALSKEFNLQARVAEMFKTYYVGPGKANEDSTRARSFTFFATALALSTCFDDIDELIIPENGTISLNVPLTTGRYGSSSTRTTHPFYIKLLQKICGTLGFGISFVNPYQFKTKGEMIAECSRPLFLKSHIGKTMSCSHPNSDRYKGNAHPKHCGTCLPCFIRMAAEYKAYGRFITIYDRKISETTISTERCIRLRLIQIASLNMEIEVQKNGVLQGKIDLFANVYAKSLEEMKDLIDYLDKDKK